MRRGVLLKSVQRLLRDDEELTDAAFLWSRHRLMVPYAALAFVALGLVAALAGFDTWPARIGIGLAGAGVAAMATTDYRVLAQTNRGFVLLRASRVRQYAVAIIERLPPSVELELVGNQFVVSEWLVDSRRFTVPKSSEQSMVRMAAAS